jgi:membrane-bound ClpP family serine protease
VFDLWQLLLIGVMLYLLFAVFTGGGSGIEGGIIDPSISIKLFPLYGVVFIVSSIYDPTYRTTIIIMVGTIFCLMLLYAAFLRNYDKWPLHEYGKTRDIVAITDINPKGKVRAGAEIWWAKTTGPPIKAGEKVETVAMSGMTLIVARQGAYSASDSSN